MVVCQVAFSTFLLNYPIYSPSVHIDSYTSELTQLSNLLDHYATCSCARLSQKFSDSFFWPHHGTATDAALHISPHRLPQTSVRRIRSFSSSSSALPPLIPCFLYLARPQLLNHPQDCPSGVLASLWDAARESRSIIPVLRRVDRTVASTMSSYQYFSGHCPKSPI